MFILNPQLQSQFQQPWIEFAALRRRLTAQKDKQPLKFKLRINEIKKKFRQFIAKVEIQKQRLPAHRREMKTWHKTDINHLKRVYKNNRKAGNLQVAFKSCLGLYVFYTITKPEDLNIIQADIKLNLIDPKSFLYKKRIKGQTRQCKVYQKPKTINSIYTETAIQRSRESNNLQIIDEVYKRLEKELQNLFQQIMAKLHKLIKQGKQYLESEPAQNQSLSTAASDNTSSLEGEKMKADKISSQQIQKINKVQLHNEADNSSYYNIIMKTNHLALKNYLHCSYENADKLIKQQQKRQFTATDIKNQLQTKEGSKQQNCIMVCQTFEKKQKFNHQEWNESTTSQESIKRQKYTMDTQNQNSNKNDKDLGQSQQVWRSAALSIQAKEQSLHSQLAPVKIKQFTIEDYKRCVGIIKCVWYDHLGRVELVGFSTAFAISEWFVVTCGHSIFDKKRGRQCDKIYFLPAKAIAREESQIYQSRDRDFLRFQRLQQEQKYGPKPLRKDYAVFILKRPYYNDCYLELCNQPLRENQPLQIWGYPCKQYTFTTPLLGTHFKRMDLEGQFDRVKDGYILVHTLQTLGGHSGSPIVSIYEGDNNEQFIKVVGIHTHKGQRGTNEGLLMSSILKDKIIKFCEELILGHKIDYYPQQIFAQKLLS